MAEESCESIPQKGGVFFRLPALLVKMSTKALFDPDLVWSPTSPLDLKPSSSSAIHSPNSSRKSWDSDRVGLGLVDALSGDDPSAKLAGIVEPDRKISIAGSMAQLNGDAGMSLSWRDITMSEDYTRIVAHGPNGTTTTHIWRGSVIDPFVGRSGGMGNGRGGCSFVIEELEQPAPPAGIELGVCAKCEKRIKEGKETFMYMGEKAFCSTECREVYIGSQMEVSP